MFAAAHGWATTNMTDTMKQEIERLAAVRPSDGLGRCATCKWWQEEEDRYNTLVNPPDPVTYNQLETEEEIRAKWGHSVRHCKNPKILFYQRPEKNAAAVVDGSNYHAALLTAEQFGCVLHERPNARMSNGGRET